MAVVIEQIFIKSRKSYGAIRVHDQLVKRDIKEYSVKQVRRIMRLKRLYSVHCRKKRKVISTTDSRGNKSIAENMLKRNFAATAHSQKISTRDQKDWQLLTAKSLYLNCSKTCS